MGYDDGRIIAPSQAEQRTAEREPQGQGPGDAAAHLREACWSDERLARVMECGVTAWGWRHRGMIEREIADEAKHRIATWWRSGRSLWAASYKARYGVVPTQLMQVDRTAALRGERRNMRCCVRRAEEAAALLAGHVGSRGRQSRYASCNARWRRAEQLEQQAKWMDETLVVDTETGEAIPLAKVTRHPRQRRAELHVVTRGMIDCEVAQGRWPYFITLTLPATWHPSPKFGRAKWDGSLPVAGQRELRRRWALARARAKKAGIGLVGSRFVEPHLDGCVHWHQIMFLADSEVKTTTNILSTVFGDLGPAVRVERARSAEGAAKYCMAYSAKTAACGDGQIGQHITSDDLSGVDAWRAAWGIRGFQLFGMKGRLGVWRECRRRLPEDAPAELRELARHARAGKFREFHEAAERTGARVWATDEEREYPEPDPARQQRAAAHGQRATLIIHRRRTVGIWLERRGICVATRQPGRWILIRAEDSAAASAAALADSCITVATDSGSERARTGEIPPAQAPPRRAASES